MTDINQQLVFTKDIAVRGDYSANYCFENADQVEEWFTNEWPKLQDTYADVKCTVDYLPGLKVGDRCQVYGEGSQYFTIEKLIKYSANRYGFILDSGWSEEVGKCY